MVVVLGDAFALAFLCALLLALGLGDGEPLALGLGAAGASGRWALTATPWLRSWPSG